MSSNFTLLSCGKVKTVDDIWNNISTVLEIIKEDVYKVATSNHIYFNDYEAVYQSSTKVLKKQLNKRHLKAIDKVIKSENLEYVYRWMVSRLVNNCRNCLDTRYKSYLPIEYIQITENIKDDFDIFEILQFEELRKVCEKTIVKGLKKVWKDSKYDPDFELDDLKFLCTKYNIEVENIIKKEELEQPKFIMTKDTDINKQLVMCF